MKLFILLSWSFLGLLFSILAYHFIKLPLLAMWLWVVAMSIVLFGLALKIHLFSFALNKKINTNYPDVSIILILFLLSLIPRLVALQYSPPFVHGDEAACGIYGRLFDTGQAPLLSIGWYGLPMFSYAISGVGLEIFAIILLVYD